MGNSTFDNHNLKKYNHEKDISLTINLKKVCYFPGDEIKGTLSLFPKITSKPTNQQITSFKDSQSTITLTQREYYKYEGDGGESMYNAVIENDTPILSTKLSTSQYIGQDLSNGINIPFSIKIPLYLCPTVIFDGNYIIHLLCVEFPEIQAKKTLIIIIKGIQIFDSNNGLLKCPSITFEEIEKKNSPHLKGEIFIVLLNYQKIVSIFMNLFLYI